MGKLVWQVLLGMVIWSFAITQGHSQRKLEVKRRSAVVVKTPRTKVVYINPKPKVRVVRTIPGRHTVIRHKGVSYFYHEGHYYRRAGNRYIVMPPPAGVRVSVLPARYLRIQLGGFPYFYFGGVFYLEKNKKYEVVRPPVGAVVPELPDEAEKIIIDGKVYYEYDNTIYSLTETNNGLEYEVVGELD
ncbi:MAG: DUF6515 family protein [Cyclobacteriaceae bacterium]